MQGAQSPEPIIVSISQTPAEEVSLSDVIFGSLGVAGALLALALVLGVVVAGVKLGWSRLHPPEDSHLPPVVPN